jgi:hypothetical protein
MKTIPIFALALLLAACSDPASPERVRPANEPSGEPASDASEPGRPMDEVPEQQTLADGGREYRFDNGCVIVLEPARAVVRTESADCELYHRDIALLYASGD